MIIYDMGDGLSLSLSFNNKYDMQPFNVCQSAYQRLQRFAQPLIDIAKELSLLAPDQEGGYFRIEDDIEYKDWMNPARYGIGIMYMNKDDCIRFVADRLTSPIKNTTTYSERVKNDEPSDFLRFSFQLHDDDLISAEMICHDVHQNGGCTVLNSKDGMDIITLRQVMLDTLQQWKSTCLKDRLTMSSPRKPKP